MWTRIANIYERMQSSYWFIPSIMAVYAMAFSTMMLYADLLNDRLHLLDLSWIRLTGAAGGRTILSTVANSMITVTGVIFSITIVSLSLTAQQYGPRLLQNFLRDRGNQAVLGTVTATYLYCLLVLRTINDGSTSGFTPHLSILGGLGLAVLCVAVLIYFIHNTTASIQVSNLIANVSRDLSKTTERLFPEKTSRSVNARENELALSDVLPEKFSDQAQRLANDSSGYLQVIDYDGLLRLAVERNLVLRIRPRIGHFLVPDDDLVDVCPGEAVEEEDLRKKINQYFITGRQRTQNLDIEFLINELVEIAGRALSPGINDPFTAIACIDHLVLALCDLAQRIFPDAGHKDQDNRIRIIETPPSYERMVGLAFNQIRQYGRPHAAVTIHLMEGIKRIMPFTRLQEQRDALLRQAAMIDQGSRTGLDAAEDREEVHKRYMDIFQTVEENFGLTGTPI